MATQRKQKNQLDIGSLLKLLGTFAPEYSEQANVQIAGQRIKSEEEQAAANRAAHSSDITSELSSRERQNTAEIALRTMLSDRQMGHEGLLAMIQKQLADVQGRSVDNANTNAQANIGREASRDAASVAMENARLQTQSQISGNDLAQRSSSDAAHVALQTFMANMQQKQQDFQESMMQRQHDLARDTLAEKASSTAASTALEAHRTQVAAESEKERNDQGRLALAEKANTNAAMMALDHAKTQATMKAQDSENIIKKAALLAQTGQTQEMMSVLAQNDPVLQKSLAEKVAAQAAQKARQRDLATGMLKQGKGVNKTSEFLKSINWPQNEIDSLIQSSVAPGTQGPVETTAFGGRDETGFVKNPYSMEGAIGSSPEFVKLLAEANTKRHATMTPEEIYNEQHPLDAFWNTLFGKPVQP